jgi:hypothetical protein
VNCPEVREDLAAYALGTLSAADRERADAHVDGCADCRSVLAEFAPLPALLSRVTIEDIAGAAVPAPDLLPRTLAVLRARRSRRRWVAAAAACVVLAGGGAAAATLTRPSPSSPPPRTVAEATDAASHVSARVSYVPSAEGTNLWLTLTGVTAGEHCQLVAVGAGGQQEVAATWQVDYEGEARVQGMTAFPVVSLRGFEIKTTDGRHLVWVAASKT